MVSLDIDNAARDPSRSAGIDAHRRSRGGGVGLHAIPCAARFFPPEMQLIIPTLAVVGMPAIPCAASFSSPEIHLEVILTTVVNSCAARCLP